MKSILLITLFFLTFNCFAQENPQFSNVFFLPLSSNETYDYIAKDTMITVPIGKVWQITSAKVFTTYENRVIPEKGHLYLNDQIIASAKGQLTQNTDPIWLPSGKYRLTIRTADRNRDKFYYIAFISGVEYNFSN